MSAFDPYTKLFDCAICQRAIRDYNWRKGRDRQIPPLCHYCEREYPPKVKDGSFMDRRIVQQLGALAIALGATANHMEWKITYDRARL